MKIETCLDNLTNGNLNDAKRQAQRISFQSLYDYLMEIGKHHRVAYATALYLKGRLSFNRYCQIEQKGN